MILMSKTIAGVTRLLNLTTLEGTDITFNVSVVILQVSRFPTPKLTSSNWAAPPPPSVSLGRPVGPWSVHIYQSEYEMVARKWITTEIRIGLHLT